MHFVATGVILRSLECSVMCGGYIGFVFLRFDSWFKQLSSFNRKRNVTFSSSRGWTTVPCSTYLALRGWVSSSYGWVFVSITHCNFEQATNQPTWQSWMRFSIHTSSLDICLISLVSRCGHCIKVKKNQLWAIWREFKPIGLTMFKNPLDAWWGLLLTLRWVGSSLCFFIIYIWNRIKQ